MNVSEYASQIGAALRNARNTKNLAEVAGIFENADATLAKSNVSSDERRTFWSNVRKEMNSSRLLVEKQANGALLELIRAVERELKAREGK